MDNTEKIRKSLVAVISATLSEDELERYEQLVEQYGADNVWDTKTLQEYFVVESFLAPFVMVRRKADNAKGLLMFSHHPRFYFDFKES